MTTSRCPCGFTRFAERLELIRTPEAERWHRVVGAMPWARVVLPTLAGVRHKACLSCGRPRNSIPIGGGLALGSRTTETEVYVVMADVVSPSCMTARLVGAGHSQVLAIEVGTDTEPLEAEGAELFAELPIRAVLASTSYRVALPTEIPDGSYRLIFQDTCLGTTQVICDINLPFGVKTFNGRSGAVVAEFGDYNLQTITYIDSYYDSYFDRIVTEIIPMANNVWPVDRWIAGWKIHRGVDFGGTWDDPLVVGLQGRPVSSAAPADNDDLVWSATNQRWEPGEREKL